MSIEVINPFSKKDMSKIKEYDNKNNTQLAITIDSQYKSMDEKIYKQSIIESYIIALYLYTEKNNKIDEICFVNLERDLKVATIIPIPNNKKIAKIITKVISFIFETTDIQNIMVKVSQNDQVNLKELNKNNYINIGADNNNIIYYIEKSPVNNMQLKIFQGS